MLKRTIYVESPTHIHIKNRQVVFKNKETQENRQCPLEDLGFLVLDNSRTDLYCGLLGELARENVAVVVCNGKHIPQGMLTSLDGHHLQAEVLRSQVYADLPLKKRLWQQTVRQKIRNQMDLLSKLQKNIPKSMEVALQNVKSGDTTNREAVVARVYWQNLFEGYDFQRSNYDKPPNHYLNYGYAVLRGAVARALVGSGLNPSLGIHHINKYNGYGLVDDIMEPYRPFVDEIAYHLFLKNPDKPTLEREEKGALLEILACDVFFPEKKRPLMNALSLTSASLVRCLKKEEKAINYPQVV